MAWTTPSTWTTSQVVGASDLNTQVRDNMAFLLAGKAVGGHNGQRTAWTTNQTSYVDIDSTNLAATLNISSGRIGLFVEGYFQASNIPGEWCQLTVLLDGADQGDATYGYIRLAANGSRHLSWMLIFSGLSAGSHTVALQWKCSANTITASLGEAAGNIQRLTQFRAWEM
jgi:hypothetical protein